MIDLAAKTELILQKNLKKYITYLSIILLVVIAGCFIYSSSKQAENEKTGLEYLTFKEAADDIPKLREFVKKSKLKRPKQLAILKIGKLHQSTGNTEKALTTFQSFLKDYPNYDKKASVQIAIAKCQMDMQKLAEAEQLFVKVADTASQYAAQAYFYAAECARLQKNAGRAKELYEKVLLSDTEGFFKQSAEKELKLLQ
ncbi:MAG: tetratricopeptide repeat protein [Verrucomicrobiota bacterium]|nr:tetratricopeptide repeat protein [Verrucomicrobiota bacterium]